MKLLPAHLMLLLIVVLGGIGLAVSPVLAQNPQPTPSDDAVNRIAKQMYCPVCENIPLDVCPTQACSEWRELIRLKLSEGWTDEQIKTYFAQQYGDRVLSEPPRRGLNWLVYILPAVFFGAGAIVVWQVLRGMNRQSARADTAVLPGQSQDGVDPYLSQLEEELKKSENT